MVYNGISKCTKDPVVDQMVDEATKVLKAVVDESWVPWAGHLIPNISHWVRAEVEARAQEAHDCKIQEEAEHIVQEKVTRAVMWDKWLEEKLTALLAGQIMQQEFQEDLEAKESTEGEVSEVVGTEDVGVTGGTQSSAMEVEEEEDEVIVVEEVKQGEM